MLTQIRRRAVVISTRIEGAAAAQGRASRSPLSQIAEQLPRFPKERLQSPALGDGLLAVKSGLHRILVALRGPGPPRAAVHTATPFTGHCWRPAGPPRSGLRSAPRAGQQRVQVRCFAGRDPTRLSTRFRRGRSGAAGGSSSGTTGGATGACSFRTCVTFPTMAWLPSLMETLWTTGCRCPLCRRSRTSASAAELRLNL